MLRLTVSAVVVVVLALGLIGLVVDRAYRASENLALFERLESAVFVVLAGLEVDSSGTVGWSGAPADSLLMQPESGFYAGVYTASDTWLSPSTLGVDIPIKTTATVARGSEQRRVATDVRPWSVYRVGLGWELSNGTIIDLVVWAAEDRRRILQSVTAFRSDLWVWLLIAAVLLVLAQLIFLAQPLSILRRVASEVRDVESGRKARLTGGYPRELAPLTENLNALLATERANAEQYQQALGDLAHSLKTPLAVLNAQIDASRSEQRRCSLSAHEIQDAVTQMESRIRSELDRASRSGRRTMIAPLQIAPLAERVIRSLQKLYPSVSFDVRADASLRANIDERDLLEVLGNLLENSAKHGAARVSLEMQSGPSGPRRTGLVISVSDDGPGIDLGRFESLIRRGARGDEGTEGQGLGLAIVRRIVQSYHGVIHAQQSGSGGLRIEIALKPD
ncbi:MAG: ATP-binding protein [Wenzhouxiangellaceae bacterium]